MAGSAHHDSSSPDESAAGAGKGKEAGGFGAMHAAKSDLRLADDPKATAVYESASRKAVRWLLPVLLPVVLVSYLDRVALSYAALDIQAALGIDNVYYGWAGSIFYVPYVIFGFPSLWSAKRLGVRFFLSFTLVWWGVSTMLTAYVTTGAQLLLVRASLGAAEAGGFPMLYLYLDQFLTPTDLTHIWIAAVHAVIQLASIIGGPFSALILWGLDGVAGLAGWQWIFVVNGLLAVSCAALVMFLLLDPPAKTSVLAPEEKAILCRMKEEVSGVSDMADSNFMVSVRSWKAWYVGVIAMLTRGPFTMFSLFMPIIINGILVGAGVAASMAAIYSAALAAVPYIACAAVIQIPAVVIKTQRRPAWMYCGIAFLAGSLLLFLLFPLAYYSSSAVFGFVFLCALYSVTYAFTPIEDSLPALFMQEGGASSAFYTVMNTVRNLSGIWTGPLYGFMLQLFGEGTATQLLGVGYTLPCLVLYILFFSFLREPYALLQLRGSNKASSV